MLHKIFHLFKLLLLFVVASHSCHHDSLVRGIVICCTKFVATPRGGRVVCPPVERVVLGAEKTHPSLFASWPCGCMHSPHPSPSSPALRRLDLLPHSCPLHHESPLAQNPLDGRGLLRNCADPWDAATPRCL
jgi:hypothetical protein